MYQCKNAHQIFTRLQWNTNRRLRTGPVYGIIRAPQPALILACIENQSSFAIASDPPSEAAFHSITHLLCCMLMYLCTINNGCIHSLTRIIQHDHTAAFSSHVLNGFIQYALKHSPQVERSCYLTADVIQKFKLSFCAVLFLLK